MTRATGCLASSRLAAQVIGGVEHLSKSKPPPTRWHWANGRDDREQRPKDHEASPRQRLRQPPATTGSAGYCCSVYLVRLSRMIVLHSCSELTSKHLKSPTGPFDIHSQQSSLLPGNRLYLRQKKQTLHLRMHDVFLSTQAYNQWNRSNAQATCLE